MGMKLTATSTPFALIAIFALGLSASGFILEYGFQVIPCPMCWWQRYAHWAIAAIAAVAFVYAQNRKLKPHCFIPMHYLIIVTALGGLAIALWQFAAQNGWLPYPASCTSESAQALANAADLLAALNNQPPVIVPCDKETFKLFGLSLAAWNIPSMLAVIFYSYQETKRLV